MKKTAIITGASGGIGREFALVFAENGYNLLLVARDTGRLEEVKREAEKLGVNACIFAADLTREEEVERVYAYAKENGVEVEALINNAGFGDFGEYLTCDIEKQMQMVQVNIAALMRLTHLFLPDLIGSGRGKILNVASVAAFQAGPLMSVYYASKAFVLSFSEALHEELKGRVKVTALCPGPIRTGFEKAANLSNSGLFKKMKVSTADKAARFGYKKLVKGKAVAVLGLRYKLLIFFSRFAPRGMVRKVTHKIMKVR